MLEVKTEQAVLGGGCFWCLDATYSQIAGVTKVEAGYAGGKHPNPTFFQVMTGVTGHAEVVQVTFDTSIISYTDLLEIFFTIHNPTQLNYQNYDIGTEYRSIILYNSEAQHKAATEQLKIVQEFWSETVVTEVKPLDVFYVAEDEQQDFFRKHPAAAYCQIVINPKLSKLREKFAARLKPELRDV